MFMCNMSLHTPHLFAIVYCWWTLSASTLCLSIPAFLLGFKIIIIDHASNMLFGITCYVTHTWQSLIQLVIIYCLFKLLL